MLEMGLANVALAGLGLEHATPLTSQSIAADPGGLVSKFWGTVLTSNPIPKNGFF